MIQHTTDMRLICVKIKLSDLLKHYKDTHYTLQILQGLILHYERNRSI